ncbi:Uma2 family endonuclease [Camelliibacillus cellulosilyticus]|uniref:Uma2 family endonuclease n=1 Tax=Camelliibacillus cellulosilyticus TaxID=2174486 RepID=A0ABV9GPL8_9BACL
MKQKKPAEKIQEAPMTYDDYAAIDDGNRYELADGYLELLSSPRASHQLIISRIGHLLEDACGDDYIFLSAPLDVILNNNEVRQPDLIAIHRNRLSIITHRGIEGIPDLVVEVLSPSSIKRDRVSKMLAYARYRVPEYWIVDPGVKVLEQYVLKDNHYEIVNAYLGDESVRSEKFACASFTMNDIWRTLPDVP